MLTPEQLAQIADHATVRKLYDQLQEDIIADMARRLSKMDFTGYTTMWQLQKLEAINAERDYIVQRLADISGKSKTEIKAVLETGCSSALGSDDQIYRLAGYKPTPLSENPALQELLNAGLKKTLGTFQNLTRTTANTATRQFEDALDRAYMQVTSGGISYQQAIKGAVIDLSKQGVAVIQYPTGHTDYMDVAVRRAVLTGVNQTALKIQDARADELGCDLVEVTAHYGARPTHAEWQGRVYSRSGKDKNYKNFYDATGYGTGDGLGGWNCRHSFFPFFKGLSRQNYSLQELHKMNRQTVSYNGRELSLYDATQMQRANEREIRALKREQAGLEGAGQDTSEVKAKLRDAQAKQRDLCEQTGLRRDYFRERGGKQNQQASPNPKIQIARQAQATGTDTTTHSLRYQWESAIEKNSSSLTPEHRQELSDTVSKMNDSVAELYSKLSSHFRGNNYYDPRTGYYSPSEKRIHMDLNDNDKEKCLGINRKAALQTKFHEEGHQLDDLLAGSEFGKMANGMNYRVPFTNPLTERGAKLEQAIKLDTVDLINKALGTYAESARKVSTIGRLSQEAKYSTIRYLKDTYPTRKDRAEISIMTDAIGLVTNDRISPYNAGFWGHTSDYNKSRGSRGATSETWATFFSLSCDNATEQLKILEKEMPRVYNAYKETLQDLIEYVAKNGL